MKTMQQKFFEELQVHLDEQGTRRSSKANGHRVRVQPAKELIVNNSYSNTGHGFIQEQGTFKTLSTFEFSFQADSASFTVNGKPIWVGFFSKNNTVALQDVIRDILAPVANPSA